MCRIGDVTRKRRLGDSVRVSFYGTAQSRFRSGLPAGPSSPVLTASAPGGTPPSDGAVTRFSSRKRFARDSLHWKLCHETDRDFRCLGVCRVALRRCGHRVHPQPAARPHGCSWPTALTTSSTC